jgi:sec-independent protein translocase protein TatB
VFDVGLAELMVIALVAVFVFGPDRLPEFAQQAGKFLRRMRTYAKAARDDLRDELGPEFADLELRDLDPRTIVRKHILEAMNDEDDAPPVRAGHRPLAEGERPPYDADAT